MPTPATTDSLRAFYDRRHPGYYSRLPEWIFLEATYRGGREWFEENLFKGPKEGPDEFKVRIKRAYRFNHTREVVDLIQKYLFKAGITRSENAPKIIKEFWDRTTQTGMEIQQFMRLVSTTNSVSGRCAVVVDNNFKQQTVDQPDGTSAVRPMSVAEVAAQKSRIYAYVVTAKDILDYAWDEDGDGGLLWVKLRELRRDDDDPFESTGILRERVRLWTRTGWKLYHETEARAAATTLSVSSGAVQPVEKTVTLISEGEHNLGFVPVYFCDHAVSADRYLTPGLIDDIAYLDRTVANYLSNLDAIIQDQTFSQLAIPASAIQPGDDMFEKVLAMGTKRVFVYDSGSGSSAKPEYLSPDPKQAGVILDMINKIINEIYHSVGLAGERTKEDNAVGIDNSSGVAKAYDFERVNSLLLSKSGSAEDVENWLVNTALAWAGEEPIAEDKELVSYPETFDIVSLADDIVIAEALSTLVGPLEVRREQMKRVADKLFPQMEAGRRAEIDASIDKWLEGTDIPPPPPVAPVAPGAKPAPVKPVSAPSRQGSVTAKTK